MSRPNWVELTRGPGDFKYKVSRLPPEYDNKECAFGMGMFAKKDYAKGEVMWVDYYFLIPNEPGKILVEYHTTEVRSPSLTSNHKGDVVETGEQDIIMHTIQRHATDQREVYFDCYCNSSCNPNLQIVSLGDHEDGSSGAFATVCAREIKKGDQLHNCYDLLEWDCKDKGIDSCACGSENCRGRSWGYKYLSVEDKHQLKPKLSITVLMQLLKIGEITAEDFSSILNAQRAAIGM